MRLPSLRARWSRASRRGAAAASLARDEGVWSEAIRSVFVDDLALGEADRSPEWWLLRMKQRKIEMIDEAVARRNAAMHRPRTRERQTLPPSTAPAQSGGRRKRVEGEESQAAPEAPPEAKAPKRGGSYGRAR
jgi:hypothetical protein